MALIHDAGYADHGMELATSLGLSATCLTRLGRPDRLEGADLIIDVDLHNLATVTALRKLLTQLQPAVAVFLADRGRQGRVGRVQAEALGATKIIDRANAERELLLAQTVRRVGLPGPSTAARLAQTPAGESIAAAAQELARHLRWHIERSTHRHGQGHQRQ